jgi:hypothetical protein
MSSFVGFFHVLAPHLSHMWKNFSNFLGGEMAVPEVSQELTQTSCWASREQETL